MSFDFNDAPGKKPTGQELMIGAIKYYPRGGKEYLNTIYSDMIELYQKEFGNEWVNKELELALSLVKKGVGKRMVPGKGSIHCEPWEALQQIFDNCDETVESDKNCFIGTKSVNPSQFCYYSKGLFFMATVQYITKII